MEPTRHEQREGRVDRYGQPSRTVRVLTFYGIDNQIDGIVLDVLIRKHKTIRNSLGISSRCRWTRIRWSKPSSRACCYVAHQAHQPSRCCC